MSVFPAIDIDNSIEIEPRTRRTRSSQEEVALDDTGKAVLDDIYVQPDPRAYFTTLQPLDYSIPGNAFPYFSLLIEHLQRRKIDARVRVIDLGCSYGINGALQKLGHSYEQLVENYTNPTSRNVTRRELIARDRELIHTAPLGSPHITGIDISRPALEYGLDCGFLDDAILSDLEVEPVRVEDKDLLEQSDLIISTGCIGYAGPTTISKLLNGAAPGRPWSAHFVLRMFSYDDFTRLYNQLGYKTIKLPGLFQQRQFMSAAEKEEVVQKLEAMGICTEAHEQCGHYYAELHLSVPEEDAEMIAPIVRSWSGKTDKNSTLAPQWL